MNLTIKTAAQYLAALTFGSLWLNIGVDLNVEISDSWIDIVNGLRLFFTNRMLYLPSCINPDAKMLS